MRPALLPTLFSNLADYWELTKFRLVLLVLLSSAGGFYLASGERLDTSLLCRMLAGAGLVAAGSMVFNQYLEYREDAQMKRTAHRPLAAGRMPLQTAAAFGTFLSLTGAALLWFVHPLSAFLAVMTHLSYILLYTPLKKRTWWCIVIGSFPGAVPPLIGWAAARGNLGLGAWVLFAIIFLWQMPHFLAIAWMGREDYRKAGFRTLPATDPEGRRIGKMMFYYALVLLPVSLLPAVIGLTGKFYAAGAAVLGVLLLYFTAKSIADMDRRARPLFRFSLLYLSILFTLMLFDKV